MKTRTKQQPFLMSAATTALLAVLPTDPVDVALDYQLVPIG